MAPGLALIGLGGTAMVFVLFGPWRRLAPPVALASIGACSLAIGAGALLVQDEAGAASWAITMALVVVLGPLHARLVFGRPGSDR